MTSLRRRASALLFLFLLAGVFFTPRASAQDATQKKPITHENVWLMKRVGMPAISPDGKWVVFSVTEPAYDSKDQASDLWIVPADGSEKPRRLTYTKAGEGDVAWNPDGKRIAFITRREGDETGQIYVLNVVEGGEAQRITTLSTGAGSPRWHSNGKTLLFTSVVFPGALNDDDNKRVAKERKERKYRARVYDGYPVRNWDHWLDDTQTHPFTVSLDGGAPKDLLAGTNFVAKPGFGGSGTNSADDLQAVWTPDGGGIVFTATTDGDKGAYSFTETHLYLLAGLTGEPKQLTPVGASYGNAKFSPDGKSLFAVRTANTGKIYHLDRLVRFDWNGNAGLAEKLVSPSFDRAVGSFAITPDNASVYLTAEDAGLERVYVVPAAGGETKPAFEQTVGCYTGLTIGNAGNRPVVVANWDSATNPAEVVRIDLDAKKHVALSMFNAEAIKGIDWQPLRHFWFTSKAGRKIHNLMVLPPNFDESKKYPVFAFIHGGPHTMSRDQFFLRWNYHFIAQPGYIVIMTNYTGSTGFGEKFAQDIQGDPFGTCGSEISEAVDAALKQFSFCDGERVAAGGASYGGHLANWLQATTTRYKCLIAHAGLINSEAQYGTSDTSYGREVMNGGPVWEQGKTWREQNPIRYAAKFKTPIMLTVGENDFRVPLNQTLENWTILQRLKVPSRLIVFPEANHWVLRGEDNKFLFTEVHAWLGKYLK